jgi:hypothetical protein
VQWLLTEARRLLDERARIRQLVSDLVSPVTEVRSLLNQLRSTVYGT